MQPSPRTLILGLILANVSMVVRSSSQAFEAGAFAGALESQLDPQLLESEA